MKQFDSLRGLYTKALNISMLIIKRQDNKHITSHCFTIIKLVGHENGYFSRTLD